MNKKQKILLYTLLPILLIVLIFAVLLIDKYSAGVPNDVTKDETQTLIDEAFAKIPLPIAPAANKIYESSDITVNSLDYDVKTVIAHCSFETVDIATLYNEYKTQIFSDVYNYFTKETEAGKKVSQTHILIHFGEQINTLVDGASKTSGEIDIYIYDVDETLTVYLDDTVVDKVFGGILYVREDIDKTETITVSGEEVSIINNNSLRKGIAQCFGLTNYDTEKPDTSTKLLRLWNSFRSDFYKNFIEEDRWTFLATGLGNTLLLTLCALILGVVVGFLTAMIRCTHDKEGKFGFLNGICSLYVTIIRGTPVMVQLLIIYFVLLLPLGVHKFLAAVICFGLNSGAYVSEIIRGGIMAIDVGQFEAGRSLGFNYAQTLFLIVLPQAFKAVLPSLCNEFIALLKETSVAFYIGIGDLTRGGLKIRAITYSNFMPLIAVALIYLIVVLILTKLVGLLERRLRKSER